MRIEHIARLAVASCACLAGVLMTSAASAATDCSTLPTPIYGVGGSSLSAILGHIAGELSNLSTPVTVVYQSPGNCFGINDLSAGTSLTGTASYWDTNGKQQTCNLPIAGVTPQFGALNTYVTTCAGVTSLPDGIGDFLGPIQSFDFVVPKASSQTVISAAAAYFVYGFGATGQAAPWTDETEIIKRDTNSAATLLVGLAINVPPEKFKGVDGKNNAGVITDVSTATNPENAIGFVAGEIADANQNVVTTLAYQHYGQSCGYWPDSSLGALDKKNVRNGQYPIWGNIHLIAPVDGSGVPSDPNVKTLIDAYSGNISLPSGKDVRQVETEAGAIPDCAMEVQRTSDFGDYQSYAPTEPCTCLFEKVATGTTSCQACDASTPCGASAPNCRFGYCEVN
jgi:ABC-type phosphate transport system substrate-binding protein